MINKWVTFVSFVGLYWGSVSGWYDALIQNKAYVDFATNAPGYGQLQNDTVLRQLNQAYYGPGGCKEQEEACYAAGDSDASNEICGKPYDFCVSYNINRYRDTLFKIFISSFTMCSHLQSEIAIRTISDKIIHQRFSLLVSTSTSLPKKISKRK